MRALQLLIAAALFAGAVCCEDRSRYFVIQIVDEQTGRGVPLVELRTVSEMKFYTDSAGIVAINEPALMEREVFFHVKSHGYKFAQDGFGFAGKALKVKAGETATLKIQRLNIAERLYRVTGEGIYRDSVLIGKTPPLKNPVLNAQVCGQDSVQMALYRGKYYWFWGDTNRQKYPLGHFGTAGATSLTVENGGLKPDVGVDLEYFVDGNGFSRGVLNWDAPGLKWLDGLFVISDGGQEHMYARVQRMKQLTEPLDRSIVVFEPEINEFRRVSTFGVDEDRGPWGHSFKHTVDGQPYIYFANPVVTTRVKADRKSVEDVNAYESFTCLKAGTKYEKGKSEFDRERDGKLNWGWKPGTAPITPARQTELMNLGKLQPHEQWHKITDAETGKPVFGHNGTIHFNAYRKRWVMIFNQQRGTSMLGEIWFTDAEKPEGPWSPARKIVTHEKYSFYNVAHHPEFDEDGGRLIYFEGTYTSQFSGNQTQTPLYDYNQVMYRLDLGDPRVK